MAKEIKMPQLGQTMEEGTVVNCLVKIGQKVNKGDILFEIETDKATLEMESPAEGFVKAILAQQGQTLPVGEVLLIIGEENEKVNIDNIVSKKTTIAEVPVVEKSAVAQQYSVDEEIKSKKVSASPRAKAKAKELNVNLVDVKGTGPGGRVTEEDVVAAANDTRTTAGEKTYKLGQKVPLSRLGKITAEKMVQSKREKPCFYLNIAVDATEFVAFRDKLNQSAGTKISFNDFIMKALSLGLNKWPIMTGRFEDDSIQLADSIDIGLAVAVKDGIVAPIIPDVDKKNLTQIAQYSTSLIERARAGKLLPDDLQGGCITVSNLGTFGIDSFIPIAVPGQCSILGVGKITDTCVSYKDSIVVRKFMKMTLAVDHRIANGAEAAQFLNYVAELLQEPQKLV